MKKTLACLVVILSFTLAQKSFALDEHEAIDGGVIAGAAAVYGWAKHRSVDHDWLHRGPGGYVHMVGVKPALRPFERKLTKSVATGVAVAATAALIEHEVEAPKPGEIQVHKRSEAISANESPKAQIWQDDVLVMGRHSSSSSSAAAPQ